MDEQAWEDRLAEVMERMAANQEAEHAHHHPLPDYRRLSLDYAIATFGVNHGPLQQSTEEIIQRAEEFYDYLAKL